MSRDMTNLRVALRGLWEFARHEDACSWLEAHLAGTTPMPACDCGYEAARVAAVKAMPSLLPLPGKL